MTSGVEESYEGPRWEEGDMMPEFMTQLLDWQKDEKKLHRKYAYKVSQQVLSSFFNPTSCGKIIFSKYFYGFCIIRKPPLPVIIYFSNLANFTWPGK